MPEVECMWKTFYIFLQFVGVLGYNYGIDGFYIMCVIPDCYQHTLNVHINAIKSYLCAATLSRHD